MRQVLWGVILASLLLGCPLNAFAAEPELRYRIVNQVRTEIENYPVGFARICPGLFGAANDVSDNGTVVGFLPKSETRGNAFVWNGDKTTRLKGGPGGSSAFAINNAGVIAGVAYRSDRVDTCDEGAEPVPARWEGDDYELLEIPAEAVAGYAYAVSEDGMIGGGAILDGDPQRMGNTGQRQLPLVWRDGTMIPLSLAMDYSSEAPTITSHDTFSSAMVVSFGRDGRIFGNGWAIDDQGIRPWQFAMTWADVNSPPEVIGGFPSVVSSPGAGSYAVGAGGGESDTPFPVQFRDGEVVRFSEPTSIDGYLNLLLIEPSADDSLVLGQINESTGPRSFIWDARDGDPGASIPIDLLEITDDSEGWTFISPEGFTNDGRILIFAADADQVHYFLLIEPI